MERDNSTVRRAAHSYIKRFNIINQMVHGPKNFTVGGETAIQKPIKYIIQTLLTLSKEGFSVTIDQRCFSQQGVKVVFTAEVFWISN